MLGGNLPAEEGDVGKVLAQLRKSRRLESKTIEKWRQAFCARESINRYY